MRFAAYDVFLFVFGVFLSVICKNGLRMFAALPQISMLPDLK